MLTAVELLRAPTVRGVAAALCSLGLVLSSGVWGQSGTAYRHAGVPAPSAEDLAIVKAEWHTDLSRRGIPCNARYEAPDYQYQACLRDFLAQQPPLDRARREHFGEQYDPAKYYSCRLATIVNDTRCERLLLRRRESVEVWPYHVGQPAPIKWPEAPKESVYRPGMSPLEYWRALCKAEGGEFIYKTVPKVTAIYQIRPRAKESELAYRDPERHVKSICYVECGNRMRQVRCTGSPSNEMAPVKCDGPTRRRPRRQNPGAILGRAVTSLPVVAFLNHLLEAAPWARERLMPFSGRTWRARLVPLPDLTFVVRENGMLDACDPSDAIEPDLVVTLAPAAIPALARREETALREMTFAGDAELAAALQYLARHLEWDVEDDLSRVVGDVAAHRIGGGAEFGRVFGNWGEIRAGAFYSSNRARLRIGVPLFPEFDGDLAGVGARIRIDTGNSSLFPTRGWNVHASYLYSLDDLGSDADFRQGSLSAEYSFELGASTIAPYIEASANADRRTPFTSFRLGGLGRTQRPGHERTGRRRPAVRAAALPVSPRAASTSPASGCASTPARPSRPATSTRTTTASQIAWTYDAFMTVFEWTGLAGWRRWLVGGARGRVLEGGCGTGRNLPLYAPGLSVVALELDRHVLRAARRRAEHVPLVIGNAEDLPFRDGQFDTVVSGLVFCSVRDPLRGLREARRVLVPSGELRMLEHVRATSPLGAAGQDAIQPGWTFIAGGCHPNRDTEDTVQHAGFTIAPDTRRARNSMRRFIAHPTP